MSRSKGVRPFGAESGMVTLKEQIDQQLKEAYEL